MATVYNGRRDKSLVFPSMIAVVVTVLACALVGLTRSQLRAMRSYGRRKKSQEKWLLLLEERERKRPFVRGGGLWPNGTTKTRKRRETLIFFEIISVTVPGSI